MKKLALLLALCLLVQCIALPALAEDEVPPANEPATHDHIWGDGVATKEPTCAEEGIRTFTCADEACGETRTETIPATGEHIWNDGEVTTDPTCRDEGVKTFTCTVCSATRTETIPATGEHAWNGGEVTTDPTCKDEGVKTFTCTVCGATRTEAIPATGEHAWNGGEVTTEPTCKDEGVKTFTCTVCGATRTEAIPATNEHVWNEGEVTTEPSCKDEGVKTFTCTVCDATKSEAIPATDAHVWDEGTVTKEATLEEDGEKTFTCTVCGETKTESIDKLTADNSEEEITPAGDKQSEIPEGEDVPEIPVTDVLPEESTEDSEDTDNETIPLAELKAGVILYQDTAASEAIGTLSETAVVLVVEEKDTVSEIRYALKEEGAETRLEKAYVKNTELNLFTAEDLEAWNQASRSAQAIQTGDYFLEPVSFAPETKEEEIQENNEVDENLPEESSSVAEEVIQDVTSLGTAAAAEIIPEGSDVLGAEAPQDVLDASGPSNQYTITAAGIITQYNGTDTVITIPNQVYLGTTPITVTGVSNTAFSRNTSITQITMPETINSVDIGCFKGCTALRYVNLPNNITTIRAEAFYGCSALEAIAWTSSVTAIEEYAFYGCTSLRNIGFPQNLTTISRYAFYGCSGLSTITWPTNLQTINEYAFFGCTALTGLSFPASLQTIGNYAFSNCTAVQTLDMQNNVTTLGTGAFSGCSALKAINIPNSVTTMGNSVFENCSGATTLSLSTGCTIIENFSFKGCRSLTRLSIPNGVTAIGREAFEGCSSLSLVYNIPASVASVGNYAFNNCAAGCIFFVQNPNVVLGTDCLGTNTIVIGYTYSTTQAYANAHSGVTFYSYAIVDFVNRCYNNILGRAGDLDGILYWTTGLARQEMSGADIVAGFLRSPEFKNRGLGYSAVIDILYQTMMNHATDPSGAAYWLGILNDGLSYDSVVNGFASSPEFAAICSACGIKPGSVALTENRDRNRNVSAFVVRCYRIIQNREFDIQGLNYWTGNILSGATTGALLVDGFISSPEFKNRNLSVDEQIEIIYRTMLNRASDPQGKAFWMDLMDNGLSLEAVVNGFASSPEFRALCNRYGITPGGINLQNRDKNANVTKFVTRNYEQALSRKGDVQGLNYWTGQILNKIDTPLQVAKYFLGSYEFQAKGLDNTNFVKTLYRLFMGREYDSQGLTFWLNNLSNGMTRESVMDSFGASPEFQKIIQSYGLK